MSHFKDFIIIDDDSINNKLCRKIIEKTYTDANIVDFTQALYTLNRAEVDLDITLNNVWQAILSKAAATGDFGIFINNF